MKLTGYKIVNLALMVEELGEEKTKQYLSCFSCPLNEDVDMFLKTKAIEFSKQGLARTHLVYTSYKGNPEIAGYFSLSNKYITIKADAVKGKLRQRINRFASHNKEIRAYCLASPLIAQIGKNYSNGLDSLITGNELLLLACEKVASAQFDLGGKFVYLECEDKQKLLDFYNSNGFFEFDRRNLDKDETGLSGKYLIQMLKYLK